MTRLVARAGARPALQAWLDARGTLAAAAAVQPGAFALEGRGTVWVAPRPDGGDGQWVVRHYHRGGAVARILGDRYLSLGVPRPLRELRVALEAEALGIPTPTPIGAAIYPSFLFYRGDIVTEYVPDSRDLATVLFPGSPAVGPDPRAAMGAAGRLIRRIHEVGLIHQDLNLKNILVSGTDDGLDAQVIDLDRARFARGPLSEPTRRRMLERFWRSAAKWERRTGAGLDARLRAAFEDGYAAD